MAATATNGKTTQNQSAVLCRRRSSTAAMTMATDVAIVIAMLVGVLPCVPGDSAANTTVTPPATSASVEMTRAASSRSRGWS